MTRHVLLLAVLAGGCSRCGSPAGADAGAARIHRSTDLKAAVFSAYPEFRGARVLDGVAQLTRVLDRPVPLEGELLETLRKNGFEPVTDGGALVATRAPYTLKIDGPRLTVGLPILEEHIGKLLNTPQAMTSEQLATWLPKIPGATVIDERFEVRLAYDSSEARTQYLAWQMVEYNSLGTWKVERYPDGYERTRKSDGGGGSTPDAYSIALVDSTTSARIELHRDGGQVTLEYLLRTEELR